MTTIRARNPYNATGVEVVAGQMIRVRSTGRWTDWSVVTDASGYEKTILRPFALLRRVRTAPWFALCGAIGASEAHLFPLAGGEAVVAPASGPLFLFANDIRLMYWNNEGELEVDIDIRDPA